MRWIEERRCEPPHHDADTSPTPLPMQKHCSPVVRDSFPGSIHRRNITDASQAHSPHRRRCGEKQNPDHGCLFTPVCKLSRSYLSCTRAGTRALIEFPAKLRASIHHYTSYTSLSSPAVTATEYNMPTSYRLLISTRETIYNANYERELSAVGDCPPVLPRKAKLVDISKPHCLMPAGPG